MKIQPIGKHLLRVTVKSAAKRKRYAAIPGVQVEGDRVIFPEAIEAAAADAELTKKQIKEREKEKQLNLF